LISGSATVVFPETFTCSSDYADYEDGVYAYTEDNLAILDSNIGLEAPAHVDLTCYWPAKARVIKATTEGSEDIGQFPFMFNLYDPSGALVETVELYGAGQIDFAAELRAVGTWTVVEVLPAGWVTDDDLTCTFAVAFPGSEDHTFECNYDNTEMSRVRVAKTTKGTPDPAQDWQFAIFEGPNYGEGSGFLSSPLAAQSTFGVADGILLFSEYDLDPSGAYTVCELGTLASAGWTSEWSYMGTTFTPYNPHEFDEPSQNLGFYCVDFGAGTNFPLTPGVSLTFDVDNSYPGGSPRTPGYWKNWSSCSGGSQYDNATGNNDPLNEFWALDELLTLTPFQIGDLMLTGDMCIEAVRILDHRDIESDKKKAQDAAFDLARNLFAYRLNYAAGACHSSEADAAALDGQDLLEAIHFDGTTNNFYLRPKDGQDYTDALMWSKTLDNYNNGLLCTS